MTLSPKQMEQASDLVAEVALELHRDTEMLIDECIRRAAWGLLFALTLMENERT